MKAKNSDDITTYLYCPQLIQGNFWTLRYCWTDETGFTWTSASVIFWSNGTVYNHFFLKYGNSTDFRHSMFRCFLRHLHIVLMMYGLYATMNFHHYILLIQWHRQELFEIGEAVSTLNDPRQLGFVRYWVWFTKILCHSLFSLLWPWYLPL